MIAYVVWFLTPLIDYIATKHRSKAMVLVVLPLSFVLRHFLTFRMWLFSRLFASSSLHASRVERVQADVRARNALPEADRRMMCTARAPWQNLSTRFSDYKKTSNCIYMGDFRNILALDTDALTVTVEPLVDVGAITAYLVPKGFMLATTLEIEEATVGGLAMAVGMTTASHKHGLLQETVTEYEMVMGDGSRKLVTADGEDESLFYALPWSHGSLGFLAGLTLRIIPVEKHVKLTYRPCHSQETYCALIRDLAHRTGDACPEFVEATVFSRDQAVVMSAEFEDPATAADRGKLNNVGWWFKPWFYKHIEGFLRFSDGEEHVEYIPTEQYIFRHNRAIFWTLRDQLPESVGNNVLFRLFLGWLLPPKVTFLKLPTTPEIRKEMMVERVYQDIVLPIKCLEESIDKAAGLFAIWPILVYPSRIYDHGPGRRGLFPFPPDADKVPGTDYGMYFDLGVYGTPPGAMGAVKGGYKAVTCMREMEDYTSKVGGAPFLYADTFLTEDEFGRMFDLELYDRVREEYGADGCFPHGECFGTRGGGGWAEGCCVVYVCCEGGVSWAWCAVRVRVRGWSLPSQLTLVGGHVFVGSTDVCAAAWLRYYVTSRALFFSLSLSLSLSPLFLRPIPFPIISYLCSTTVYDKTAGGERVERWQAAEKREKLD